MENNYLEESLDDVAKHMSEEVLKEAISEIEDEDNETYNQPLVPIISQPSSRSVSRKNSNTSGMPEQDIYVTQKLSPIAKDKIYPYGSEADYVLPTTSALLKDVPGYVSPSARQPLIPDFADSTAFQTVTADDQTEREFSTIGNLSKFDKSQQRNRPNDSRTTYISVESDAFRHHFPGDLVSQHNVTATSDQSSTSSAGSRRHSHGKSSVTEYESLPPSLNNSKLSAENISTKIYLSDDLAEKVNTTLRPHSSAESYPSQRSRRPGSEPLQSDRSSSRITSSATSSTVVSPRTVSDDTITKKVQLVLSGKPVNRKTTKSSKDLLSEKVNKMLDVPQQSPRNLTDSSNPRRPRVQPSDAHSDAASPNGRSISSKKASKIPKTDYVSPRDVSPRDGVMPYSDPSPRDSESSNGEVLLGQTDELALKVERTLGSRTVENELRLNLRDLTPSSLQSASPRSEQDQTLPAEDYSMNTSPRSGARLQDRGNMRTTPIQQEPSRSTSNRTKSPSQTPSSSSKRRQSEKRSPTPEYFRPNLHQSPGLANPNANPSSSSAKSPAHRTSGCSPAKLKAVTNSQEETQVLVSKRLDHIEFMVLSALNEEPHQTREIDTRPLQEFSSRQNDSNETPVQNPRYSTSPQRKPNPLPRREEQTPNMPRRQELSSFDERCRSKTSSKYIYDEDKGYYVRMPSPKSPITLPDYKLNHTPVAQPSIRDESSFNISISPVKKGPFQAFSAANKMITDRLSERANEKTPGRHVYSSRHRSLGSVSPPDEQTAERLENIPEPRQLDIERAAAGPDDSLIGRRRLQAKRLNSSESMEVSVVETVESTHSDSDDAEPPVMPDEVLGSRAEPIAPSPGIYGTRRPKSVASSAKSKTPRTPRTSHRTPRTSHSTREANANNNNKEYVTQEDRGKPSKNPSADRTDEPKEQRRSEAIRKAEAALEKAKELRSRGERVQSNHQERDVLKESTGEIVELLKTTYQSPDDRNMSSMEPRFDRGDLRKGDESPKLKERSNYSSRSRRSRNDQLGLPRSKGIPSRRYTDDHVQVDHRGDNPMIRSRRPLNEDGYSPDRYDYHSRASEQTPRPREGKRDRHRRHSPYNRRYQDRRVVSPEHSQRSQAKPSRGYSDDEYYNESPSRHVSGDRAVNIDRHRSLDDEGLSLSRDSTYYADPLTPRKPNPNLGQVCDDTSPQQKSVVLDFYSSEHEETRHQPPRPKLDYTPDERFYDDLRTGEKATSPYQSPRHPERANHDAACKEKYPTKQTQTTAPIVQKRKHEPPHSPARLASPRHRSRSKETHEAAEFDETPEYQANLPVRSLDRVDGGSPLINPSELRERLQQTVSDRLATYHILREELMKTEDEMKSKQLNLAWQKIKQRRPVIEANEQADTSTVSADLSRGSSEEGFNDERMSKLKNLLSNPLGHLVSKAKDLPSKARLDPKPHSFDGPANNVSTALDSSHHSGGSTYHRAERRTRRDRGTNRSDSAQRLKRLMDDIHQQKETHHKGLDLADDTSINPDTATADDTVCSRCEQKRADKKKTAQESTSKRHSSFQKIPTETTDSETNTASTEVQSETRTVTPSFSFEQNVNNNMAVDKLASRLRDVAVMCPSPNDQPPKALIEEEVSNGKRGRRAKEKPKESVAWFIDENRREKDTYQRAKMKAHSSDAASCWFVPMGEPRPWKKSTQEKRAVLEARKPWLPSNTSLQSTSERRALDTISRTLKEVNRRSDDDQANLQDVFRERQQRFISASRERQRIVKLRSEQRQMHKVHDEERARLFDFPATSRTSRHPCTGLRDRPRRAIPKEEMYCRTNRMYKSLPEVKNRQSGDVLAQEKMANRIRQRVFNKKVQKQLLSKSRVSNLVRPKTRSQGRS